MLYLLLAIYLLPLASSAQADTKITQNTAHPNLDYKQMDAPMPPLWFMTYQSGPLADATPKKHSRKKKKPMTDTGTVVSYRLIKGDDKEIDNNANLLVMMFNPTCGHCEDMAVMLRDNISSFKKSNVVLLANKMMQPYIPGFIDMLRISNTPHLYVGYDSSGFIDNLFLYQTLPQINIYSPDRKLLKTYCGEVPMDTLRKFIQ